MDLTPKIIESLSQSGSRQRTAVLSIEGDVAYIEHPSWMLALTRAEEHIRPDLLHWLLEREGNTADWEALSASDIDFVQGEFLSCRSRKYRPLLSYSWGHLPRARGATMLETHASSIWGEVVDLTAMYTAGKARPVYGRPGGSLLTSVGSPVRSFWFKVDRRIVAVDGGWLEAFTALGLRIQCPVAPPDSRSTPHLGLTNESGDVLGLIHDMADSGITTDSAGRPLYADASTVSWEHIDTSLEMLGTQSAHPLRDTPASLEAALESAATCNYVRKAVGPLRWAGWSDGKIAETYMASRASAMWNWHASVLRSASRIHAELTRGTAPWAVRHLEHELKQLCERVEVLQHYLGEIDLGLLPEAARLLPELETV